MDEEDGNRLETLAERIRKSGVLGKSVQINRLFDYLLDCTLQDRVPKEVEIAHAVFEKPTDLNLALDPTVRVCAHRLRKKLREFPVDDLGERIDLPPGEYRLVRDRSECDATDDDASGVPSPHPPSAGTRNARHAWLIVLPALLLAGFAGWLIHTSKPSSDPRIETTFWRGLTKATEPTLIVSGDTYVYGERGRDGTMRLIADPRIGSRADLDEYKMQHPEMKDVLIDLNAHTLPEGLAPALTAIAPILGGLPSSPQSITMSRFTTDMLNGRDIVYLGLLGSLGDLRDPLFENTGFALAEDRDTIMDRATGRRFKSDWGEPTEQRIMRRDYGYLATFPGPAGNRIIVIAGVRDPALAEMAQISSDKARLDELGERVGNASAFEALYEVQTFGPSHLTGRLVLARPLRTNKMWPANSEGGSAQAPPQSR